MIKTVSGWFQLLLLAGLLAIAAGLWVLRDDVGQAIAGMTGNAGASQSAGKEKRKATGGVPVIVAEVDQAANDEIIAAVGTARARRSIMLHSKTDGIIVELLLRAGDRVEKGDVVARLDATKADLAVQIATRRLQEAGRLFDRSEFLKQRSVNSSAKVEDAKTTQERAELELLQAEEARRDLDIVAPFAGIVGIPNVETGERITTASPIVSLDQRNEVLVEFEVAERYLSRIAAGNPMTGHTPSHDARNFTGSIEYIDSRVDPVTRTVKVRAVIPNKDDLLRPGMSFVVEVELPGAQYAVIPELSLQWRKGESYVWIVNDGKADKVLVTVKNRLNSTILVDGDLQPGQLVVVEGVQRLRPGRAVDYAMPPDPASKENGATQSIAPQPVSKG